MLLVHSDEDSLISYMLADARALAEAQDWASANEILSTAIDLLPLSATYTSDMVLSSVPGMTDAATPLTGLYLATARSRFEIESGVDYSQQEFEVTLLENDSVIAEQLQSPYASISLFQPFILGAQQFLCLQ